MSITLYSTNCPKCMIAEQLLNSNGIDYELVNDPDVVLDVAQEHGIATAPFANIDGEFVNYPQIMKFINGGEIND